MYGLLNECKFLTIEETNNKKKKEKIMIITSHMQKIIQIYRCLILKLSCKQDTILNIGDFSTKN
jgi:hypothetical protein